ncbi:MAG TPA: lipopolysaccharide transport periplasmic protein LptA [Rhodobacteraceae bacterium]|nr:lipopolysaccharide transport periplasmic protein LptA [Paracoccaceae bacterium]
MRIGDKFRLGCFLLSILPAASPLQAQDISRGLAGFSAGSNTPILIEAEELEVRENGKVATFRGHVEARQDDTTLTTRVLRVYYSGGADSGRQQITRIVAEGDVFISKQDQTARGDRGDFDMRTETVVLSGNVILTQGETVITGNCLSIDLQTKRSRIDTAACGDNPSSGPGKKRVRGLFVPKSK